MIYHNKNRCKNRYRRSKRRKRKTKFKSSDHHIVKSRGELIVDKYLHRLNIKHIYEPRSSEYGGYIPDWVTENGYVIEYFGIKNNYRNYNQKTIEKIKFFTEKFGNKFIAIFPDDLTKLNKILQICLYSDLS